MKLIAGLGNPGVKYVNNRHNVGFGVVDAFATENGLTFRYSRDLSCYFSKSDEYILIKPNTFMNESGVAVKSVSEYYEIGADDILVVHDELDLEFGKIRLSFNGSSAGHKGVASVVEKLGTMDFARLRVGIGRPSPKASDGKSSVIPADKYVLQDFSPEEQKQLPGIIAKCQEAVKSYLADGVVATMNRFN